MPAPGTASAAAEKPRPREWAAHMWVGCDFFAWMRILIHNRFAVHPPFWHVVLITTVVSLFHTLLRVVQEILYRKTLDRAPLRKPPLIILGHWRTGTTLLHEMLILDERHTYPTTYQCFAPHHFLISEWWMTRLFHFIIPAHRPMDNMAAGFDRPQEDEFALCMLGVPSTYWWLAFPNRPQQNAQYLDLQELTPKALGEWKRSFERFLRRVNFKNPAKRLILKSPPHTCRLPVLLDLFPDALFVHIVRDPQVVIPSTVNMWKALSRSQGLQRTAYDGLEDHVFGTFDRMYERFEETRDRIDPRRFHEVRYEDLIADPVGEMRKLYEQLGLGDFDRFQPALEQFWDGQTDYKTNRYKVSPEQRKLIAQRCTAVIERYGYSRLSD
jgi:omega-hydroxy-beta-dihydromenaquinone-9 sulfotransferase